MKVSQAIKLLSEINPDDDICISWWEKDLFNEEDGTPVSEEGWLNAVVDFDNSSGYPTVNEEVFKDPKWWVDPANNRVVLYGIQDDRFYVYAVPSDRSHATYYAVSVKDVDDLDETIKDYKPTQGDTIKDKPVMRVVPIYSVTTTNNTSEIKWEDMRKFKKRDNGDTLNYVKRDGEDQ
jgi:hypothetical protein